MKKLYILSILVLAFTFIITSCSKKEDTDTTLPTITLNEPEDGDSLRIGADVHFECDFQDDVMLGSYLIEIHNNFDGHSHKSTRAEGEVPFFFKKSYDLSGLRNSHEHHHDVVIPENTQEGKYHLVVYCTDAAGNQSLVARDIVLSHNAAEHHHDHDDDDNHHDHEDDDHDHED